MNCAKWRGEDLSGKIILLIHEQGAGDQIQFIRYAGELKKRWPDCTVWFQCGPGLAKLMSRAVGVDQARESHYFIGHDYHCYLMSLPHLLGTTLETVPNDAPYFRLTA